MENDVLKNQIAPWQEKGRWYHGVVNIDTSGSSGNASLVPERTDELLLDDTQFFVRADSHYIFLFNRSRTMSFVGNPIIKYPSDLIGTSGRRQNSIYVNGATAFDAHCVGVLISAVDSISDEFVEFWVFIIAEEM